MKSNYPSNKPVRLGVAASSNRLDSHTPIRAPLFAMIKIFRAIVRLRDINQMERDICQYLEWDLGIDPGMGLVSARVLRSLLQPRCITLLEVSYSRSSSPPISSALPHPRQPSIAVVSLHLPRQSLQCSYDITVLSTNFV
ncbi:hypothetical protein BDR03DRAFT_987305 [Suillus americanus]|nr:hypothetical protein BDR03DRAFT_987305 [Suillus americanus]